MTALDDLLNSSSYMMYPASVVATWQELEPGYNTATGGVTATESINQLGQQIGPDGLSVSQSFDDGLPDAVTATSGNDASGQMEMDLVGRPSAVADDSTLALGTGVGLTARNTWLESFSINASNGWATTETGQAWTTSGGSASDYSVSGGLGRMSLGSLNVPRRTILPGSVTSGDVRVQVNIPVAPNGDDLETTVMLKYQDDSNNLQASIFWSAGGQSIVIRVIKRVAGVATTINESAIGVSASGASLSCWLRVRWLSNYVQMKAWPSAGSEPAKWLLEVNDSTWSSGRVGLRANLGASFSNGVPQLVTFDNFSYSAPEPYISTAYPAGIQFWDYALCVVTVGSTVDIVETTMASDSLQAWRLLGDVIDGPVRTWVFGRRHFVTGVVAPVFQQLGSSADPTSDWTAVIGYVRCGRTPSNSVYVPVLPNKVAAFAETVSGTAHTVTPVELTRRGFTVAAVGASRAAGAITATGGATVLGQYGIPLTAAIVGSPIRTEAGTYGISFNTANASADVAALHIGFEVRDRPQLDGTGYFSPLNSDSPVYGFDRDTADLTASTNHVSLDGTGTETTRIFTGQMAGIDLADRTAEMVGVSRTRLLLDNLHTLPTVNGDREGATTDWLATYLLSWGKQFPGIATSEFTRWWAPWHGSLHPHLDGSTAYAATYLYDVDRGSPYGPYKGVPLAVADGPFVSAMYGEQKAGTVLENVVVADRNWPTDVPGQDNPKLADPLSQLNTVGRFSCWVRGDDTSSDPIMLPDDNAKSLFLFTLWNTSSLGLQNYVRLAVNKNRSFTVWIGSALTLTGGDLPIDGQWHFLCFTWDYAQGAGYFQRDGVFWNITGRTGASEQLPTSLAAWRAAGGATNLQVQSHLPAAELQFEAGLPFNNDATRFYPTPAAPSRNATYRVTNQPIKVIANDVPVQGWSTLQEVAQSTLSWMRVNEQDNVELVPLSYFGETAQMTVDTLNVLDTAFNAGELALGLDPTQTRNVVTLEYKETRVGSNRESVLELTTGILIPTGTTFVTFALDKPIAEPHGGGTWYGSTPDVQKLTAAQVAGTNPIQNENVMSVNTRLDGTGAVLTTSSVTARVVDWDSSTVTVRFINGYGKRLALSNNGSQIPFLRILGYPIVATDAFSTSRDNGSITRRRERALTTGVRWIQDRTTAEQVGSTMATILARPRPVINVTVQGDPRRTPGKLCQIVDSTGVRADGTWRILSIRHRYNGPMYVQDVSLIRVGSIALWDQGRWDEEVWGA